METQTFYIFLSIENQQKENPLGGGPPWIPEQGKSLDHESLLHSNKSYGQLKKKCFNKYLKLSLYHCSNRNVCKII